MTREEQKENLLRMSGTDVRKCMKCGKCSGRCPAFREMDIKPHQFVSLLAQGKVEKLLAGKAIWNCLSCMACVERCPRGVAPAAVVEAVRDTVVRMQNGNGIKAEDIPPIVDELIPQQLLVSAYRKYNK
ncbi:MAG TPA: 4Fe-4S dicluster domain-containing protein [Candidatus Scatosoma pullicola]|nr:4Fe-4S dicluster domain-containing protein [Candidatus Scatosoma pullicola]